MVSRMFNVQLRDNQIFRIIVLVSVERMTAVLWPLKARLFWTYKTLRAFVVCILIASILVSMHLHITHQVTVIIRNATIYNVTTGTKQIVERPALKSMLRRGWEDYWRISTLLDTFLLVFIPVLIVVLSNLSIVCSLHNKETSILVEKEQQTEHQLQLSHQSSLNNSVRGQRRATFIVCCNCFHILNFTTSIGNYTYF